MNTNKKIGWIALGLILIAVLVVIISMAKHQVSFGDKQACGSQKSSLEKTIQTYNDAQQIQRRGDNDGSFSFCYEKMELGQIFYSEKLNSCLYIEKGGTNCAPSPQGSYYTYSEYYYLMDNLTNTQVDSVRTIWRGSDFQKFSDVAVMINKYK